MRFINNVHCVQTFDWMRDLTEQEEAEVRETYDCEDTVLGPVSGRYVSPCFKLDDKEHAELVQEAERLVVQVDLVISGEVRHSFESPLWMRVCCLSVKTYHGLWKRACEGSGSYAVCGKGSSGPA